MEDKEVEYFEGFMREALNQANLAAKEGEVPVGAVIVKDSKIISRARNSVEKDNLATKHAEVIAIEKASEKLDNWRLSGCELYVTLEPCPMCLGAILLSRVDKVIYGAKDPRQGVIDSVIDLPKELTQVQKLTTFGGILEEECSKVLKDFFKKVRNK